MYEVGKARFGEEITDVLFSAFVRGVFAADHKQLSMKAAFPAMWHVFKPKGVGFTVESGHVFRVPSDVVSPDSTVEMCANCEYRNRCLHYSGDLLIFYLWSHIILIIYR